MSHKLIVFVILYLIRCIHIIINGHQALYTVRCGGLPGHVLGVDLPDQVRDGNHAILQLHLRCLLDACSQTDDIVIGTHQVRHFLYLCVLLQKLQAGIEQEGLPLHIDLATAYLDLPPVVLQRVQLPQILRKTDTGHIIRLETILQHVQARPPVTTLYESSDTRHQARRYLLVLRLDPFALSIQGP